MFLIVTEWRYQIHDESDLTSRGVHIELSLSKAVVNYAWRMVNAQLENKN